MIAQCQRHRRHYLGRSAAPRSPPLSPALVRSHPRVRGEINDGIREFSIGNFYRRILGGGGGRTNSPEGRERGRQWVSAVAFDAWMDIGVIVFSPPRLNYRRASRVANGAPLSFVYK